MGRTITTQRTAKTWKLLSGLGTFIMLIGLIVFLMGLSPEYRRSPTAFVGLMIGAFVGFPLRVFSRVGAWWFHN